MIEPDDGTLLADGFENALMGFTSGRCPTCAVYDRAKCIEILMTRDGMSREDAEEFFMFNTEGAWMGERTPIYVILNEPDDPPAPRRRKRPGTRRSGP